MFDPPCKAKGEEEMTTAPDQAALAAVKDVAEGWEGNSAVWIAERAVSAYLEALPPAQRMWAWFPSADNLDFRYCALFDSKYHARVEEEGEACIPVEIREIREPAAGEGA